MMSEVKVTFPDGSVKGYPPGTDGREVARSVSGRLAREAVAVKVASVVRDLDAAIDHDAAVRILTFDDREGKEVFWHSTSHVMAQAVLELFPQARPAIGPSIEEGFYYDFEVPQPFSPDDLERIEKRMKEIIKADASFSRIGKTRQEAIDFYRRRDNVYKVELLEEITDDQVTFYHQSEFEDLCRGPHLPRTGMIKAFKLTSSSGAYWRGDEKQPMLQRIYGISFPKRAMLEEHLRLLEEAKKRDHRVLGKQLELYTISEDVGAGLILWLPKGARVRNEIENFWRSEHLKYGYELVYSPHIAHREIWDRSGHNDFFRENMFGTMEVEQRQYQLKPMNCPFHIYMYKSRLWSYRDLPLRWAELGTVYRYERAGVLHGLLRVRGLTQDDAHHFVTQDKMEEELVWILDFCIHILKSFGFNDYAVFLSTRPQKAIGDDESWERAEAGLRAALERSGLSYEVDEGEGTFYGPKIDLKIKDSLNRSWQCSTIQFDFSLPERFDLHYIDTDGKQKRPFMIHRALLGAIERFFGLLIEHYAGCFPLWLAPVQVKVLPITDGINEYGRQIVDKLKAADIRAVLDDRSEKIGAKIRDAELQKVPYMFVVGAKEAEAKTVSMRKHGRGDLGAMTLEESLTRLNSEIVSRGLNDSKETD